MAGRLAPYPRRTNASPDIARWRRGGARRGRGCASGSLSCRRKEGNITFLLGTLVVVIRCHAGLPSRCKIRGALKAKVK